MEDWMLLIPRWWGCKNINLVSQSCQLQAVCFIFSFLSIFIYTLQRKELRCSLCLWYDISTTDLGIIKRIQGVLSFVFFLYQELTQDLTLSKQALCHWTIYPAQTRQFLKSSSNLRHSSFVFKIELVVMMPW